MSLRLPSRAVVAVALVAIPLTASAQPNVMTPTTPTVATSPAIRGSAMAAPSGSQIPTLSPTGERIPMDDSFAPINSARIAPGTVTARTSTAGSMPNLAVGERIVNEQVISDRVISGPNTTVTATAGSVATTDVCDDGYGYGGVGHYGLGFPRLGFPYAIGSQRIRIHQLDSATYDSMYGYIGHGGITAAGQIQRAAINQWVYGQAVSTPWHGQYYHVNYGRPVALVVPPTAAMQTKWAWGVGNTVSTPIFHQFGRQYPGPYQPGMTGPNGVFLPTPYWPSNTDQFGVYYVRGPW